MKKYFKKSLSTIIMGNTKRKQCDYLNTSLFWTSTKSGFSNYGRKLKFTNNIIDMRSDAKAFYINTYWDNSSGVFVLKNKDSRKIKIIFKEVSFNKNVDEFI